ncbi:hypothetical protein AAF712_011010 [Marasmius tenuissimus]|uniref:F-box protein n=1 Tax=Marasmius tenuissimus TaxID=585030 RepID=A0ABR2ZLB4_9AGAR
MTVAKPLIDFTSHLPNEILIKIIEICVEEGQRCLDQDEISRESDEGWNGLQSQTALQLERCQDQLLTVFWNGWSMPKNDNKALGLTCAKSAQWRRADLSGYPSSFFDLSAHEMTFPELTSLCLYFNEDIEGGKPQIRIPDSLRNARKLHELTLSAHCDAFRHLSALPWAQITHFTAEYLDESPDWRETFDNCTLYDTLPRLTNVQHCSLEVHQDMATFSGSPIILPLLHTLILTPGDVTLDASLQVFGALTLPALRKLQIHCNFLGPYGLFRFLDRSQCQLEEFGFDHGCINPESTRATLLGHKRLQSIRALKIPGGADGHLACWISVRALQYPLPGDETTQSVVLPNLVSLTFTKALFDNGEEVNALMDMLSSCRNIDHLPSTVARLQELTIQGEKLFALENEGDQVRFEKLCGDGLVFRNVRGN